MTVDETIKHCEDIAKILWCEGKEESAEEHLILAAWLRDYKRMQEPKTGHWIEHPEIETSTPEYLMFYECSECSDKQCFCKSDIHKKRFCSNCGAKMEADQ